MASKAREMMDALGTRTDIERTMAHMEDFGIEVPPNITVEFLLDLQEELALKYFTEEEMDGIIAFYTSPIGRSLNEKQPMIQKEAMERGFAAGKSGAV